jgi:hypothetical protein
LAGRQDHASRLILNRSLARPPEILIGGIHINNLGTGQRLHGRSRFINAAIDTTSLDNRPSGLAIVKKLIPFIKLPTKAPASVFQSNRRNELARNRFLTSFFIRR